MEFDDVMGTTTITTDSVSEAENLIHGGLLAALSLLDDEVMVAITFGNEVEAEISSSAAAQYKWTERNDWGREVIITVDTLLRNDD
jgi:hypothetical protein